MSASASHKGLGFATSPLQFSDSRDAAPPPLPERPPSIWESAARDVFTVSLHQENGLAGAVAAEEFFMMTPYRRSGRTPFIFP